MRKIFSVLILLLLVSTSASGATYYFSTSGDDSRTSEQAQVYTTPWKTMGKLESSCANGTNTCLLKCEDTWGPSLISGAISVSGAATIGAYRASDGAEVDGTSVFCASELPTLDIEDNVSEIGRTGELFSLTSDSVTIKYIRMINICGLGIAALAVDDVTIEGCKFDDISGAAIYSDRLYSGGWDGAENWTVTKNIATDCAMKAYPPQSACIIGSDPEEGYTNPQCFNVSGKSVSDNHQITNNYISGTIQEGINCSAATCEYNVIVNADNVGLYDVPGPNVDSSISIIRYNMVIQTSNPSTWCSADSSSGCGSGIRMDQESSAIGRKNAYIYGNIIIGTNDGIRFIANSVDLWDEIFIYNNTIIDTG